jgi:hypothetical protein
MRSLSATVSKEVCDRSIAQFAARRICDELRLSVPKISLNEAGIGVIAASGKLRKLLIK